MRQRYRAAFIRPRSFVDRFQHRNDNENPGNRHHDEYRIRPLPRPEEPGYRDRNDNDDAEDTTEVRRDTSNPDDGVGSVRRHPPRDIVVKRNNEPSANERLREYDKADDAEQRERHLESPETQAPWQRLNFLPEPHQQGSLRPTSRSSFFTICCGTGGSATAVAPIANPPAAAIASAPAAVSCS